MDTTTRRGRLLRAAAAVTATTALALGLGAGVAAAAPNNGGGGKGSSACSDATGAFNDNMAEAKFWIRAADRLAGAGNESGANAATDEANHFLDAADGALNDMQTACAA